MPCWAGMATTLDTVPIHRRPAEQWQAKPTRASSLMALARHHLSVSRIAIEQRGGRRTSA